MLFQSQSQYFLQQINENLKYNSKHELLNYDSHRLSSSTYPLECMIIRVNVLNNSIFSLFVLPLVTILVKISEPLHYVCISVSLCWVASYGDKNIAYIPLMKSTSYLSSYTLFNSNVLHVCFMSPGISILFLLCFSLLLLYRSHSLFVCWSLISFLTAFFQRALFFPEV